MKHLQKEIDKAIAVYGSWKREIIQAIETEESEWVPQVMGDHTHCDLGKILNKTQFQLQDINYTTVYEFHRLFHLEAARVLKLALSGETASANLAICKGSIYEDLLIKFTRALLIWKKNPLASTEKSLF